MNRTPSVITSARLSPDRELLWQYGYVVYFFALLVATVVLPSVLAGGTALDYPIAVVGILHAVTLGYLAGLGFLLVRGE